MARAARNKTKSRSIKVNFEGVETISVVPEGEYIASVTSVKLDESQNGNDYLAWELAITDGKNKGKKLYHNTSLAEQSLWATKKFLENLGVEVGEGEMELELDDYVDMEVGLVVEHETYKGRTRSRVVDSFPAEGEASEKGEKDDEEKASYTEDQVNEMGKRELKALVDEHELDVELDGSTSTQRRAVIKALKAEGLLGDEEKPAKGKAKKPAVEDEEDDEKPAKGRRGKKPADDEEDEKPARGKKGKKKTYTADEVNSMDEEGLGEIIETHELDVDLDDHSTMKRKRGAVIDALEGAELLED